LLVRSRILLSVSMAFLAMLAMACRSSSAALRQAMSVKPADL
jgi:hypothetical protein